MDNLPVTMTLDEVQAFTKWKEMQGQVVGKRSKADKYAMTNAAIRQQYDIVRINNNNSYYYKKLGDTVYERLDDHTLDTMVRDVYLSGFGSAEPKELKDAAEMVKRLTSVEMNEIDNNLWCVTDNSFWDTEAGELTRNPEGYCFRRLFNTRNAGKHVAKIPAFTSEQDQKMWDVYDEVKAQLEAGEFEERYEFIKTWANGSHDVYLDIMRSIAYCFVKKKPVGSYILVGLRRNGKSTFVGLLHTIFGRENTSEVRLSQLGDPHYVNKLKYTMMNAPDEEDEKAIDAQASFKTIADHGFLTLSVMRSNEPIEIPCNFMCFYPMNHIPDWKGTGAAACMKRSLIIPFYADLSKFDKSNYNFAEATFTADMMCDFMGCVFAYAHYYSHHELEFSGTMLSEQETLEEEVDSAVTYRKQFEKYFDGFDTLKTIYQDYCNWCKAQDLTISSRQEFKFVFREYFANRTTTRINDDPVKVYRIPNVNHHIMRDGLNLVEVGKINWLHEHNASMVERLELYFATREGF